MLAKGFQYISWHWLPSKVFVHIGTMVNVLKHVLWCTFFLKKMEHISSQKSLSNLWMNKWEFIITCNTVLLLVSLSFLCFDFLLCKIPVFLMDFLPSPWFEPRIAPILRHWRCLQSFLKKEQGLFHKTLRLHKFQFYNYGQILTHEFRKISNLWAFGNKLHKKKLCATDPRYGLHY